jgi:hypothetical protein
MLRIFGILICTCLACHNAQSQIPWSELDYLEISLTYSHSFGGKRVIRLVQFSKDSCFYEFSESKAEVGIGITDMLINMEAVSCEYFDSVRNKFNRIQNDDILLHHKNLDISDGFRISLALSNGNSSITYQLRSPRRRSEHIEDFKEASELMIKLTGSTWKEWMK